MGCEQDLHEGASGVLHSALNKCHVVIERCGNCLRAVLLIIFALTCSAYSGVCVA